MFHYVWIIYLETGTMAKFNLTFDVCNYSLTLVREMCFYAVIKTTPPHRIDLRIHNEGVTFGICVTLQSTVSKKSDGQWRHLYPYHLLVFCLVIKLSVGLCTITLLHSKRQQNQKVWYLIKIIKLHLDYIQLVICQSQFQCMYQVQSFLI